MIISECTPKLNISQVNVIVQNYNYVKLKQWNGSKTKGIIFAFKDV